MLSRILVYLGLDKSGFDANLGAARKAVNTFSKEFGLAIGGGSLAMAGRQVLQMADDLKTAADTAGVTAKFLQQVTQGFEQNGVAANISTKAIQKFGEAIAQAAGGSGERGKILQGLGVSLTDASGSARGFQDVFLDVAEALKNTDSEQEKLRMSMKLFGEEGAQMVSVLKLGNAEVSRILENTITLTEREVETLAAANGKLKEFQQGATIVTAKMLDVAGMLPRMAGYFGGGMNIFDAMGKSFADLFIEDKPARKLKEATEAAEDFTEVFKEEEEYFAKMDELAAKIAAKEWDAAEAAKEKLAATRQTLEAKLKEEQAAQRQAQRDRSGFSLSELAAIESGTPGAMKAMQMARQVQQLREQARMARLAEFGGGEMTAQQSRMAGLRAARGIAGPMTSDELTAKAQGIADTIEPLVSGEKSQVTLEGIQKELATLRELATGTGLQVQPRMAK